MGAGRGVVLSMRAVRPPLRAVRMPPHPALDLELLIPMRMRVLCPSFGTAPLRQVYFTPPAGYRAPLVVVPALRAVHMKCGAPVFTSVLTVGGSVIMAVAVLVAVIMVMFIVVAVIMVMIVLAVQTVRVRTRAGRVLVFMV